MPLVLSPAPSRAAPAEDHGALQNSSARYAEARRRLDGGDHDGAVQLLAEGLAKIPDGPGYGPTRARTLLLLVEAQEAGFASDGHLERLRSAARLLDRYLGPLDLLDEEGRGEAEERLRRLTDRIAHMEDTRRRATAEREAAARRQQSVQAHAKARRLTLAGSVATGSGIAALAVMGLGFSIGKTADNRLTALAVQYDEPACIFKKEPCDSGHAKFRALRLRENIGDAMFVVGAAVGGVLLATGTILLVVARKQRREARALELVPTPTASAGGLGLALFGRF